MSLSLDPTIMGECSNHHANEASPVPEGRTLSGPSPLRVVSVSHTAANRLSGRLRYEAAAKKHDVNLTLVVPERWREYGKASRADPATADLDTRVEPIRFPSAGPAQWYLHHYPRLGAILREARPDVIHLWEEPWSAVALQAVWIRDRYLPKAALVLETDQNIFRHLPPPFEQIRRYVLPRTDLLIGRGEEALEVSRRHGYRGPTEIVEYGVDAEIFNPRVRDEVHAAGGRAGFTLGYVGRLVPEKGLSDVIAAMALCPIPVDLLLLGSGPQKEPLLAQAAALGLGGRIQVFEPRPPAEVAGFMAGLDALVLMSRTTRTWKEQFGRVIMEAQACGVPVIGSSSGSIPSVVGRGGWTVEEGDVPALATLLNRLAATPEEVVRTGFLAREDALRRFHYERIADSLVSAWRTAAAVRAPLHA